MANNNAAVAAVAVAVAVVAVVTTVVAAVAEWSVMIVGTAWNVA